MYTHVNLIASPETNKLGLIKRVLVSSDKAKEYGYIKPQETENKVTVLDAIIVAHEELYTRFKKYPKSYFDVAETDFISRIFGVETFYAGFRVNNELPWDENDNGLTANKAVLKEDDDLNLFIVHDRNYNDIFLNFEDTETFFAKGYEIKIRLLGERHLYSGEGKKPLKDFTISVIKDKFDIRLIKNYITDEDGYVYFKIDTAGEYYLTVTDGAGYYIAPYNKIIVI